MARKSPASAPLPQEDRDALLKAVQSADQPLEASKAATQATTSRRVKSDEAVEVLEQFVSDGRLKVFPPKTSRGKPRYWDRDPLDIGRTAILELIGQSTEPLTAKQIKSKVKLPFKLNDEEVAAVLQWCLRAGRIHEIPAKTAKSGPRYWHHDAYEYARQAIPANLAGKGPQTEAGVKRPVKWLPEEDFKRLLKSLIESREIFRHPAVGSSKTFKFGDRPPSPEPYLKDVGKRLAKVVEKLTAADVTVVELRRAIIQVVESAGVPFTAPHGGIARETSFEVAESHKPIQCSEQTGRAGSTARTDAPAARDRQSDVPRSTGAVDLVSLMRRIEPGADRGALVTSRDLRRAANLSKTDFDHLVLEHRRQGTLVLHRHDFASSLNPEERDELVTDGNGNYYVGVALRSSASS